MFLDLELRVKAVLGEPLVRLRGGAAVPGANAVRVPPADRPDIRRGRPVGDQPKRLAGLDDLEAGSAYLH